MAAERSWFNRSARTEEEPEVDRLFRVNMSERVKQLAWLNFDAQFFKQFAAKAVLKALLAFPFPAGKLPQAAQVIAREALGYQQLAIAENEAGCDLDCRAGLSWQR
jgi:hypothetical protein